MNEDKQLDLVKLEIDLETLKKENESLKNKITELRSNNNSFLYTALVKAQAEMPIVGKNASTFGKQRYADLAEIVRASRPVLVKYGLAVTQVFDENDILITTLCHVSGQYVSSNIKLRASKPDDKNLNQLQEIGKSITYLRRYSYSAIIGIVTDEDTDGN